MTIWILALVLLAAGASLGFSQGAIRVSISFIGIVIAALFAGLLGDAIKPLLPHIGIQNPILIWLIAPLVAFILILIVFKVVGFFVHRKIYLFYKYKAGDLRMALWKRLNSRLGVCVGLMNGTAYLLLASFVIYNLSYWTVQVAPGSDESFVVRTINRMGEDLQGTGLDVAARSLDSLPPLYYQLADFVGLLRQNPQLKDRLEEYPAFLSLGQSDEFKQLGQDGTFQSAWQSRAPISQILHDSQFMGMLKNGGLTTTTLGVLEANWDDLHTYLQTGQSPKYASEKILGQWGFDVDVSVGTLLLAHPRITAAEVKAVRALWSDAYAKTILIAAADHQAYLQNIPRFKVQKGMATVADLMNFQGQWENEGTNYNLSLDVNGHNGMTATTDGVRLTVHSGEDTWIFDREF